MSSQSKQQGTFPILASSVICECMAELGMEMTDADLREPKSKTMASVYENFVDLLMGVSRDDSAPLNASNAPMDVLEHPELHDTSISEIKIVKALMVDVNAPDAKRTKRALSALINFAKFREERISTYTQQTILTEDLLDRREELQQAVELVQQRLARLMAADESEREQAKLTMAEVEVLQNEVQLLNKKQAVLQAELRDAKAADQVLADKLKQTKQILSQEVNTATLLRAQIVDDPEHVRRHIADVRDKSAREREQMQAAEAMCHTHQDSLNTLIQIEKDVALAKEAVQQVGTVAARRAALSDEAKRCEGEIKETESVLREQSATMQNVQFTIDATDDKAKRLRETHAKRRETALETLRQCRQEKLHWDKDRLSNATKINQQEIAAKQIDKKIAQTTEAHALEMDAMRTKMYELESALQAYHHRLTVAMAGTN